MYRPARLASLMASLAIAMLIGGLPNRALGDDSQGRDVPTAFSPFEYLVGQWKGQGVPKDNAAQRFRGWPESHAWAWVHKRQTERASVAIEGEDPRHAGKDARPAATYRLDGTVYKPLGSPIVFEGALDSSGKMLVLDQIGSEPTSAQQRGRLRLSLRPNSNFVRYSMWVDRKEPGAVQFSRSIEVGLTKEGETLAAGSTTAERPTCIHNSDAATKTQT